MPDRRFKVLAVATHPVQYQVPIFRQMARREDLELEVAYCTLRGAEAAYDPEFEATIRVGRAVARRVSMDSCTESGSGKEVSLDLRIRDCGS